MTKIFILVIAMCSVSANPQDEGILLIFIQNFKGLVLDPWSGIDLLTGTGFFKIHLERVFGIQDGIL